MYECGCNKQRETKFDFIGNDFSCFTVDWFNMVPCGSSGALSSINIIFDKDKFGI